MKYDKEADSIIIDRVTGSFHDGLRRENRCSDGGELIDYAAKEQDEDARPAFTSQVEDFESYDVVFVGYPNMEQGFYCV